MPMILTLTGPRGSGDLDRRTLRHGTLSIGRAPGNDWVLPDPDRHLSKTHCMIVAADGRYILTDVSTNGVFINGASERVPRNGQIELTDGDAIGVGDYTITVSEAAGHAPLAPGAAPRGEPLADPGDVTPDPLADDPFDAPPPAGFMHPIAAPPPGVLRANDPFDLADEANRAPHYDPDADLFRGVTPSAHWRGPSQPDNADAPVHAFAVRRPVPVTNFEDLDIDALLGDTPPDGMPAHPVPRPSQARHPAPPAVPVGQQPVPTPLSAIDGIDALLGDTPPAETQAPAPCDRPATPRPVAQPQPVPVASPPADTGEPSGDPFGKAAPTAPTRTPRPSAQGSAAAPAVAPVPPDASSLIAAFLDGAGVSDLSLGADPEAAMRSAGAVFRAMVEGLRQVLISRAAIKNEFRVEQTMLRARDNNALKFSVTTEDALAALLQPDRPGYQPPVTAAQEAFDDVRGHELAVMAGVQAALMALLRRFEPGALEKRLMPGMLDNLLPAARKARTWELFCVTYKDIAHDAEGDFQSVFGREFVRAYDAQVRKL